MKKCKDQTALVCTIATSLMAVSPSSLSYPKTKGILPPLYSVCQDCFHVKCLKQDKKHYTSTQEKLHSYFFLVTILFMQLPVIFVDGLMVLRCSKASKTISTFCLNLLNCLSVIIIFTFCFETQITLIFFP